MPTPPPKPPDDIEANLRKLGQHIREGWAKKHVPSERSLQTVRDAVREQWQKEREEALNKPATPEPEKTIEREPDEPDRE